MLTKELVHNQVDTMPEKFSVDQLIERLILVDENRKRYGRLKKWKCFY